MIDEQRIRDVLEKLSPYCKQDRGSNHPQSVACREAADLIAELARWYEDSNWKPISTAPKDGTWVDVNAIALNGTGRGRLEGISWADGHWRWPSTSAFLEFLDLQSPNIGKLLIGCSLSHTPKRAKYRDETNSQRIANFASNRRRSH